MTSNKQARVHSGIPDGGQFAVSARSEADVTLAGGTPSGHAFSSEVAAAIETKRDVADRAWRAPSGPESSYLYGKEYVAARHLALLSSPSLVDDPGGLEKASGQMLRTGGAELAQEAGTLFPRPLTDSERSRVVRQMAEHAVANDALVRSGSSLTPDATRGTRDGAIEALCDVASAGDERTRQALADRLGQIDLSGPGAVERVISSIEGDSR